MVAPVFSSFFGSLSFFFFRKKKKEMNEKENRSIFSALYPSYSNIFCPWVITRFPDKYQFIIYKNKKLMIHFAP